MIGQAPHDESGRHLWRSFGRCFLLCLAVAMVVTLSFRLPVATALLALLFLACPLAGLWVYLKSRRPLPVPLGPVPRTRGRTLNWLAPWYDGMCARFGLGREFRDRILALAEIRPGDHVLDIGCGTGVLTRMAARAAGPHGVARGIDPAPDMIRIAREQAGCGQSAARFDLAAIEALPFPDASFDAVLISLVLHHLPPALKAAGLRETRRVLKPGGRLIAVTLDRPSGWLARLLLSPLALDSRAACHVRGQTADILRQAGFEPALLGCWHKVFGIWRCQPPASDLSTRRA